ncbi:hypothetical protein ColLi_10915 [Colletotrichum liriopes]|uniref:Uncharacterized protein n=1 Tax=Colletotrichum liriopes TaxID=708192 RepID=A0AA37LXB7_9PEZI|nr:hypothetical protein ColLi_10915 [Colletotrichum liriopes]
MDHNAVAKWPVEYEIVDADRCKLYLQITGSTNFLSTGTRPGITYATSRLCEANSRPASRDSIPVLVDRAAVLYTPTCKNTLNSHTAKN